ELYLLFTALLITTTFLVNHSSNPKFCFIGLYCLVGNNKDGLAVGSWPTTLDVGNTFKF
ncbi:hypothetical protein ACJX0J_011792, partial [Zea mays]